MWNVINDRSLTTYEALSSWTPFSNLYLCDCEWHTKSIRIVNSWPTEDVPQSKRAQTYTEAHIDFYGTKNAHQVHNIFWWHWTHATPFLFFLTSTIQHIQTTYSQFQLFCNFLCTHWEIKWVKNKRLKLEWASVCVTYLNVFWLSSTKFIAKNSYKGYKIIMKIVLVQVMYTARKGLPFIFACVSICMLSTI